MGGLNFRLKVVFVRIPSVSLCFLAGFRITALCARARGAGAGGRQRSRGEDKEEGLGIGNAQFN